MTTLDTMTDQELQERYSKLFHKYEEFQKRSIKLDMSRGKPCAEQLDLSAGLIDCLSKNDYTSVTGVDCRNYGGVEGIKEARELCAQILDVEPNEVLVGGNSSLNLMHDIFARAMLAGLPGSETPWSKLPEIKFLCPSPGYDRHFAICEYFGITMIPIPYLADGPDMDQVEKLVAADDSIKGIWCVPKYSNPTGITYSDSVVKRLASMPVKAADFRIFWDNAYVIHHLEAEPDPLLNILDACKKVGTADRVFLFSSTSKVTFPGSGLAMVAGSEGNINWLKKQLAFQTIGPDKLNQLRQVHFFKNLDGLKTHMHKHAAIIKPKFDLVIQALTENFKGTNLVSWSQPRGGYFISVDTLPGCAQKVVAMAAAAGVVLTGAGATFPYGKDPEDRNIRIAPTYPPLEELKLALEVFVLCIEIVSLEKELTRRNPKAVVLNYK